MNKHYGRSIRATIVLLCLVALPLCLAAPASASTQHFEATFRQNGTCSFPVVFCGTGTVARFGQASSDFIVSSLKPIPGSSCQLVTGTRTITLTDGSGTLVLAESGVRCFPGNTLDAPGLAGGGPFKVAKTYTIVSGTGVFAGASGSGTENTISTPGTQVAELSGTIVLG